MGDKAFLMKTAADYPENRGLPMKTRAEARVV
jgi:hypothetical protein